MQTYSNIFFSMLQNAIIKNKKLFFLYKKIITLKKLKKQQTKIFFRNISL